MAPAGRHVECGDSSGRLRGCPFDSLDPPRSNCGPSWTGAQRTRSRTSRSGSPQWPSHRRVIGSSAGRGSLGRGDEVFERAGDALRHWRVHEGAGLVVEAGGPPAVGVVVAMAAPLPVGFVEVVCRVVDVIDSHDRFGFAYGTLSNHPEQGEESFVVVRSADGAVTFEIVAVSRHRQLLARAFPPVARRLQVAATNRYFAAMQAAVDH